PHQRAARPDQRPARRRPRGRRTMTDTRTVQDVAASAAPGHVLDEQDCEAITAAADDIATLVDELARLERVLASAGRFGVIAGWLDDAEVPDGWTLEWVGPDPHLFEFPTEIGLRLTNPQGEWRLLSPAYSGPLG